MSIWSTFLLFSNLINISFVEGGWLLPQKKPLNRLVFSNNQLEYVIHSLGPRLYKITIFTPKWTIPSYTQSIEDQFYLQIGDFCDDNLGKYFQYCFDSITRFRHLLPDVSDQMRNDEYFCAKFRWRCDRDRKIIERVRDQSSFRRLAPMSRTNLDQGSTAQESPMETTSGQRQYSNWNYCIRNSAQYHAECSSLYDNKPFCRSFYILCHVMNKRRTESYRNEGNLAAKSSKSEISNLQDVLNFFDQLD